MSGIFCGSLSRFCAALSCFGGISERGGGQGFSLEIQASFGFSRVLGVLLLGAVSALILKCFGFRGAPLVAVVALLLALSYSESALAEVFGLFSYLSESSGASLYVSAALKAVGISYLSGISIDVCKEIGESGIAKGISLLTKLELILISVPYIKEILSSVSSLIQTG